MQAGATRCIAHSWSRPSGLRSLDSPFHPGRIGQTGEAQIEDRPQSDVLPDVLQWTAHPLRQHRGRAAAAIVVVLLCGVMVATSFQTPMTGLLAAGGAMAVLLLTLNRFFLPTTFAIDREGISAAWPLRRQRLRWTDLRRFAHDDEGGFLSTRRNPTRWQLLRSSCGMHVLFGGRPDAVIEAIEKHLPKAAT